MAYFGLRLVNPVIYADAFRDRILPHRTECRTNRVLDDAKKARPEITSAEAFCIALTMFFRHQIEIVFRRRIPESSHMATDVIENLPF